MDEKGSKQVDVLDVQPAAAACEQIAAAVLGVGPRQPSYEVRNATDYFGDLPDLTIASDMCKLAGHILDSKAGEFDPATFRDRREEALLAHLKARLAGAVREQNPTFAAPTRVITISSRRCAGASQTTRNQRRHPRAPRQLICVISATRRKLSPLSRRCSARRIYSNRLIDLFHPPRRQSSPRAVLPMRG